MPTYEYQCETCGATFDVFQSIKAAPLRKAKCESCGGVRSVRRLIGKGGGIIFKGAGFYETDYRSDSYKKAAKAETDPAGKTSTKSGKDGGSGTAAPTADEKAPSSTAAAKASTE